MNSDDSSTPDNRPSTPIRLLRRPEVLRAIGLQRAALYELMRAGRFPKPVRITARSVGWIESEVQEWLAERVRARGATHQKMRENDRKE
jgi:prophage regulatory protein